VSYGLNKKISLKDYIALGFLTLIDIYEYGNESYHSSWHSYPKKFIPFGRTEKYLQKLSKKDFHKTSTYFRLKKERAITISGNKLEIDLSSSWWHEFFNYRFRFFTASHKWDHMWRIIIYDIPEKHRLVRDKFRKIIGKIGFECWQRSVWLTINPIDKLLKKVIKDWNLTQYVTAFTARNLFDTKDLEMIKKLFKPAKLENNYRQFLAKSEMAIESKRNEQIKDLIDNFPYLILEDSGIPNEFFEDHNIRAKVIKKYKHLISA
jgi:DNA-binding transcriptional regulator PaaX